MNHIYVPSNILFKMNQKVAKRISDKKLNWKKTSLKVEYCNDVFVPVLHVFMVMCSDIVLGLPPHLHLFLDHIGDDLGLPCYHHVHTPRDSLSSLMDLGPPAFHLCLSLLTPRL